MTASNNTGSDANHSAAETTAAEAVDYADQAKSAAGHELKDVASAFRTAADEMRSGSPQERTFGQIADTLADASDAVRDKDFSEMVGAVTDFALRNPMTVVGGAALLGFAATRIAKASCNGHGYKHARGYAGAPDVGDEKPMVMSRINGPRGEA